MKQLLSILALLGVSASALGQSLPATAADPAWGRVQSIAVGNKIRVTAASGTGGGLERRQTCSVTRVDADGLSCTKGPAAVTFSRREIVKIEADHHARNTGVGAAIGAGVGVAIEQGFSRGIGLGGGKAGAAVGSAGLGAVVFGGVGYLTGWRTVYAAPASGAR
jgi:hypothetical protein